MVGWKGGKNKARKEVGSVFPREVAVGQVRPHLRLWPGRHCVGRSRAGCTESPWDDTRL